jgi:hypothetical protein
MRVSSVEQRWMTPPDLFEVLHQEFGFVMDAAAEWDSRKVAYYLGPDSPTESERDALAETVSWGRLAWEQMIAKLSTESVGLRRKREDVGERGDREITAKLIDWLRGSTSLPPAIWLNPPYGRGLHRWMARCRAESEVWGVVVVALIYARTETDWWRESVLCADEIRYVCRRIVFLDPATGKPRKDDKGRDQSSTAPSAIVVFRPHAIKLRSPRHLFGWDWKDPDPG